MPFAFNLNYNSGDSLSMPSVGGEKSVGIQVNQIVSAKEFHDDWPKYVAQTQAGQGPIGVAKGDEIVGVFLSVEDYEAAFGAAVKRLLRRRIRSGGPTFSSENVLDRVKAHLRKKSKRK